MMFRKDRFVKKVEKIVGPERVLTSPEDLYVYSFETIFEDPIYSNLDLVVKAISEDEIAQIEKLAEEEGFGVVQRGRNADLQKFNKMKGHGGIILDTVPPPDITAFDERLNQRARETEETIQKLKKTMCSVERSPKNLASVIEALFLDKMISQCRDCKVCTGYCTVSPTFNHVETWSAKGRYLLTRGFTRGNLKPSKKLAEILYSCTLCGLCYAQCIPDLRLDEAILEARGMMAEEGLAPESTKAALKNITEYGNPMGASEELRARGMKTLPENLLKKKANVLYWAGCNTVLRSGVRATATATVRVLNAAGVDVMTLGKREGCCGFSLVVGGFFEEAKRNAEQVINAVDEAGVEMLVTSCSGCYETFADFYPNKLDVEMPCQVLHSSQLVERLLKDGELALNNMPMRVSYHDPCGLGRHCGVYGPPRELLRSIPDLQLIEPRLSRERSRCCGGGGGFWGVNSRASMNIANTRITEDIMPLHVDALATACPLCHTNFLYTSIKHSIGIKIYDIMEIMEMALKKEK